MKTRTVISGLAGILLAVPLAAAAPSAAKTQYYPGPGVYCISYDECYPIAYSYVYYSDPEKTQVEGYAYDTCVGGYGGNVYVSNPYIPTPYYDQTQSFVCTGMGPYLPPDW